MKSFEYISLVAVALLVLETVRLFNLHGSYAKGPLNPYAFFTDETRLTLEATSEKAQKGELSEADAKELADMDYKVKCSDATWRFDGAYSGVMPKGTVLRSDQMGNYMAGYAAGYSDNPAILYLGVRIDGIRSAIIANNERWLDQDSVPDIWHGFLDGFNDFAKDHPVRHRLRRLAY